MKAVVIDGYGGPEKLRVGEVSKPSPAAGEVLVRVHYSSINPIDWKIRKGMLRLFLGFRFPKILGFDLCGQVESRGPQADRFQPGDWVFARSDRPTGEAHAQWVSVGEQALAKQPQSMTPQQAATVPLAALTALQSLRDLGGLQTGQRTLLLGASGGVGVFALQLARAMGARVTAVCGPANIDFVRELGAEDVANYRQPGFLQMERPFDVIFDAVGLYGFRKTRHLLTRKGVYVSTLPTPALMLRIVLGNFISRQKARLIWVKPRGRDLQYLARLSDEGMLQAFIDSEYSLDEIGDAHRRSETGRVRGKISIRVD